MSDLFLVRVEISGCLMVEASSLSKAEKLIERMPEDNYIEDLNIDLSTNLVSRVSDIPFDWRDCIPFRDANDQSDERVCLDIVSETEERIRQEKIAIERDKNQLKFDF